MESKEKHTWTQDDLGMGMTNDSSANASHAEPRTSSSIAAYFNIICIIAGTGCLALPEALKDGGWVAVVFFFLVALLATYSGWLLIECLYYRPGYRLTSFSDVGRAAFGSPGYYGVKVLQYTISLSVPTIYIILSGMNLHQLITTNATGAIPNFLSERILIALSGVVIGIPFLLIRTMREVTLLGVFGTLATVVTVLCVVIQGAMEYSNLDEVSMPEHQPINIQGLPLAMSSIFFSFGGNVVFPQVEGTMRNPRAWQRVVLSAIFSVMCIYLVIAIPGYLYYGTSVKSPVLASMSPGPGTLIGLLLITIHVILAAPIYLCSVAVEIEETICGVPSSHTTNTAKPLLIRLGFRTMMIVALTLIAMYFPHFKPLMAVLGAIASSSIIFIVPVMCHYKLMGWRARSPIGHVLCILILLAGAFGLFAGSAFTIIDLVKVIKSGE